MAARPQVSVYNADGSKGDAQVALPGVFLVPIRPDVVNFVHTQMRKNKRQAYGVQVHNGPMGIVAGHQHSAHSWGTGRAVSRIPRVNGSGTHRAGQAAFGNMCRGGRMFDPTKTWRKWHRKINKRQRRYATVSALAASAVPGLVMARGHRVDQVEELPIVVSDIGVGDKPNAKKAGKFLSAIGLDDEIARISVKTARPGKGSMRGRRFKQKRGPLIIYGEDNGLVQSFRNIKGVDTCQVGRLNLLQLAPGGHLGRLIVWTKDAFEQLNGLYGDGETYSTEKKGYKLPRTIMTNSDLTRLINSDEIQSKLRPQKVKAWGIRKKKNGLKNLDERRRLNPNRDNEIRAEKLGKRKRTDNRSKEERKRQKTETYQAISA